MKDQRRTKAQLEAELPEEPQQRLELEAMQRQSEEGFRRLVENAPDIIFRLSLLPAPHFDYLSPAIEQITGYPPEMFYTDPAFVMSCVHPEDRSRLELEITELLLTDEPIVYRFISRAGEEIWLEQRHVVLRDGKGSPVTVIGIARDRTEQLLGRAALQQSLGEKALLLTEIHHRVKNNLTLVGSLLELQALRSNDERLREMLAISQQRILSVARVHEALCQSENDEQITLNVYLKRLSDDLAQALGGGRSTIHYDLETITVSMRNAVQFGLIVNELISNAFKHAFPPDFQSEPSIEIRLRSAATGIETTVTDNGVGLPMGFSLQDAASLGLQVVCSLTEQLGGEVQFISTAGIGTSFIVTVPSSSLDRAETCLHTPKPAIGQEEPSR